MTMIPFRKATIAMFACTVSAILLDTTPAHAQVGVTHCGANACAQTISISPATNRIVIETWGLVNFHGHFQLQGPGGTNFNSKGGDVNWTVDEPYMFKVPFDEGHYCFTAWKYNGKPGDYTKVGGTCFDIST